MRAESTVVVSGAGTGIGRAVASRLAADGFHVTAVGRRKEPLELLAGEIGQRVYTVTADVAMKAALHGLAFDLARELGPHGGTANVIAPGFVPDTEFWAGRLTAESRQDRAAQTLVGRAGTPAEIASLIAWLLGPEGGWMTGQVLSPNGGAVLGR
jgi:NAD(P)-dependent dehydrogenase (short-subunit alcohol dehydrogenase family)